MNEIERAERTHFRNFVNPDQLSSPSLPNGLQAGPGHRAPHLQLPILVSASNEEPPERDTAKQ